MNTYKTFIYTLALCWISFLWSTILAEVARMDGDVIVAGMFEVQEQKNGMCTDIIPSSVMEVEAVKWYFKQVNKAGDIPLTIGMSAYKTCRIDGMAGEKLQELMESHDWKNISDSRNRGNIIGLIGPTYSSEAKSISTTLSSLRPENRILQIGYSTTAMSLSDSTLYPNFFRVIVNDKVQIKVMTKTMKALEWNRIAIIHEDDTYGTEGAVFLQNQAQSEHICISAVKPLSIGNSGEVQADDLQNMLREIIYSTPPIRGVVLFGSIKTADQFLTALDTVGFVPVPTIIFAESIGLKENIFKQSSGVLSKSKGSFAVSNVKRVVQDFQDYWNDLFKNTTLLSLEAKTNPWLIDVFKYITQCNPDSMSCVPLDESQLRDAFLPQSVYVQYAILGAHVMAKAIQRVHSLRCPTERGLCQGFKNNFKHGDMIQAMTDIKQFDLSSDFSWKVESLSHLRFSLNSAGDIVLPDNVPEYQVFNFRQLDTSIESDFTFTQVANFTDGSLEMDKTLISDYDSDGKPLLWPHIRKAQCTAPFICSECIPTNITTAIYHVPGDLYIVGIVPIYDILGAHGCGSVRTLNGYQIVESFRYAIDKINDRNGPYSNLFLGKTVGLLVLNSCNSPLVVSKPLLDLHMVGMKMDNGSYLNVDERILGYVGGLGSTVSIYTSRITSLLKRVQMSYAATNPTLSDKSVYPYFMRVTTPDDKQAAVMIKIVKELKGNYVQVLYSEGSYGEGGRDALVKAARENKICITQETVVPEETSNEYHGYIEDLRRKKHAKIVIVFLRSHVASVLLKKIAEAMEIGEFVFIGSEAWAKTQSIIEGTEARKLVGSVTLVLEMIQSDELRTHMEDNFQQNKLQRNSWKESYFQKVKNCYSPLSFDKSFDHECSEADDFKNDANFQLNVWDIFSANAMLLFLQGAGNFFKKACGTSNILCEDYLNNPNELAEEIKTILLDLDGDGTKDRVFDSSGDGVVGYRIYNIQKDSADPSKLKYVPVGKSPLDSPFIFEVDKLQYPDDSGEVVSTCPNEQACEGCYDATKDQQDEQKSVDGGIVAMGVIIGILVLAVVGLVLFLVFSRRRPQLTDKELYIHPITMEDRPEALGHTYTPPGSCEMMDDPKPDPDA